ncbi:MAG TPA: hypothetical protein VJZ03_06295, partial [Candidatus Bathyarchaeia archaeon]|nr:hypothetical protein [Candidatus Bathyarchaeia archaeon]
LTKAISELGDELAYRLTPPNTEITQFLAKEENSGYSVHFSASLQLCYSSLSMAEGVIFVIDFDGDAISEEPTPPELSHLLDMNNPMIMILSLDDFYKQSVLQ